MDKQRKKTTEKIAEKSAEKAAEKAAAERRRKAKKRKYDGTGKQPLEKIAKTIPESEIYTELLAFEKHLDSILLRKRLLIHDSQHAATKQSRKTVRLSVYNTYENQGPQYFADESSQLFLSEPPSWTLRIEGQLLGQVDIPKGSRQRTRKFTSFFKRIFVQLDPEQYSQEDSTIEWDRSHTSAGHEDTDGFEIKRNGDRDVKIKIFLHLDYHPPRFRLAPALSQVIGAYTDTKPRILVKFWQYTKQHKLQDPEDRQKIVLNSELKQVFGVDSLQYSQIPELLNEFLGPPEPIELDYTVKVSGDPQSFVQIHDIIIEDDNIPDDLFTPSNPSEINLIDAKIAEKISRINSHRISRDFMLGFSLEPVQFLNNLVASQARDYKLQQTGEREDQRYGRHYDRPFVMDAVSAYLEKIGQND